MTATNTNRVVWQDKTGVPGVIRERELPTGDELGDRKVLVKVQAWGLNPCDAMLQQTALPFVKHPVILGQDIAGIVEAVTLGSAAASKFSVGDRVFGFTANNGFEDYVPLDYTLMVKQPTRPQTAHKLPKGGRTQPYASNSNRIHVNHWGSF